MAARADSGRPELVRLRDLRGRDLEDLLAEETQQWRHHLRWDFSPSADLVSRYLDMNALNGFAVWAGRRIAGYCYYVLDDHKALIGDLFLSDSAATAELQDRLLEATLRQLFESSGAHRVESQLMLLPFPVHPRDVAARLGLVETLTFDRIFMLSRNMLSPKLAGDAGRADPPGFQVVPWTTARHEPTARLLAACYEDHVDSRINDQYRSVEGARRFVSNIVLYPGCGQFHEPASFAAIDVRDGSLLGVSLASLVAPGSGHVTQICVLPHRQGQGIGRRLMDATITALSQAGCTEVSLTVTAENRAAVELYRKMDFQVLRDFTAHVWRQ
jgi:ribosomal protein S18 acetylase RimI-like enzyme